MKLTKRQRKDNDRIRAFLAGEPFQENARDKNPKVPDLSFEDIMEQYSPPDISGSGQFFTPVDMAHHLLGFIQNPYMKPDLGDTFNILEPSAGIGNLLHPVMMYDLEDVEITAFEIERECLEIGQRFINENVNWIHDAPWNYAAALANNYDLVLMNPPFGTRRGTWPWSDEAAKKEWGVKTKRSEHLFLELALLALRPGGQLLALAPYNWIDKLPKKAREWFDSVAVVEFNDPMRPERFGEFKHTNINVHIYHICKRDEDSDPPLPEGAFSEYMNQQENLPLPVRVKAPQGPETNGRDKSYAVAPSTPDTPASVTPQPVEQEENELEAPEVILEKLQENGKETVKAINELSSMLAEDVKPEPPALPPMLDYTEISRLSQAEKKKVMEQHSFPEPNDYFSYKNMQHVTPDWRRQIIQQWK